MWLTFFCNTTNITHSRMDLHTTGYAWRYVRASMTLVGLLPPLSDQGNMLVDGGYTDNLPVQVMLNMGASSVFAVDVGSIDDTSAREFGESVSGWWVLFNRWNPWSTTRNIPSITEMQARLAYVSSVKTLEEAKNTPGVLYMRMPVECYGTMQFGKFTEIMEVGYKAGKEMVVDWQKEGKIPSGLVEHDGKETTGLISGRPGAGRSIRRNSI
jgi:lysophospholipid hydrolase